MQKNIWIAAKYLRLSIEDGDKAESESIVNQSILIDNYMKSTSDITIVETFKDDGFSGTDFKRPGFQAMLKAIENKEINCSIVKDLSRFGSEHIDVVRYIQKVFPQLGVRFIAINDNYDSETANITDTHLVLPVKSFVNDTYCRQYSQKVRSHFSAKRNIGEYVGYYVSYGYKKCDADNVYELRNHAYGGIRVYFRCVDNKIFIGNMGTKSSYKGDAQSNDIAHAGKVLDKLERAMRN